MSELLFEIRKCLALVVGVLEFAYQNSIGHFKAASTSPYLVTYSNVKSIENFLRFSSKTIIIITSNFRDFESSGAHLDPSFFTFLKNILIILKVH